MPAPASSSKLRAFLDEALPPGARAELAVGVAALIICWCVGHFVGWNHHRRTANSTEFWPFYTDTWFPGPVWSARPLLPLGVFILSWPLFRRWLGESGSDGLKTLSGLVVCAWAYHLTVGLVRHGAAEGLTFTFHRPQEYWNDVRYVTAGFLENFPEVGRLSQHGATHPPGPTLFLALVQKLGFANMLDAELACTPIAALTALPLYGAARRLTDETTARVATALYLFAGSVTAFAVLSMDVLPMFFGALALYGMARALDGEWPGAAWLGLGLFGASLCNFIALTLPLTFGAFWVARPDCRLRRHLLLVGAGATCFLGAYGLLWLVFGYRPVHVFQSCLVGLALSDDAQRPRLQSLWRGPLAYVLALGLPPSGLFLRSLYDAIRRARRPRGAADRRTALLLAGAAAPWLFAVAAGRPRAETEHVFLLFVPTTALVAAAAARRFYQRAPRYFSDVALPLLALQAIAVEIFYETYW